VSELAESAVQDALIVRLMKPDLGWQYVNADSLPREHDSVLLEEQVIEALVRLNPVITERPERVHEVLPRLRATLLAVTNDGLVAANEEIVAWLCGRKTFKFSESDEYVAIRLIDFDHPRSNRLIVSTEVTFTVGIENRRYDLVLYVNGFPVVVGETKTPISRYTSWLNGASDIYTAYEVKTPAFFVPNILSFATDGKELRYGAVRQPPEIWLPWSKTTDELPLPGLQSVQRSAELLLAPEMLLDILRTFTLFSRRSSTSGRGGRCHRRKDPRHNKAAGPRLASSGFRQDPCHGLRRRQTPSTHGP
jgi:type I restriction enzyme, R subunit